MRGLSKTCLKGRRKDVYIVCAGFVLSLGAAAVLTVVSGKSGGTVTELAKPSFGEGSRKETLLVETGEGQLSYTVEIPEESYADEEVQQLLDKAKAELPGLILGENVSLEHVEKDLALVTGLEGNPVLISWSTSRPEYLQYDGTLAGEIPGEGIEISLEAELSLQNQRAYYCTSVTVFPLSEKNKSWEQKAADALQEANADSSETVYYLPDQVGDTPVVWRQKADNPALPAALLILTGGVLLAALRREKEKEAQKNRGKELLLAYPEFINRIVLYLGAGLSVRQTFIRMVSAGEKRRTRQALQSELSLTVRELQQGMGETQAYRHLGERSGLSEYRTLSTLLVQNVKKGNRELLPMLQQEAEKAYRERGRQVKILGSEAQTKLLLPMVLMLIVVLALILFPAIASFQLK